MSIGSDLRGSRPASPSRPERTPDIAAIPRALYTLRAIVLGAAAIVGVIGVLAFVQMPDVVPDASEAAAGIRPDGLASGFDCEAPCLGRAVAARELDVLPMALDYGALALVTRAGPEPPMSATKPPGSGPAPDASRGGDDAGEDDEGDGDEHPGMQDKGGREGGKAKAGETPGKGHGQGRDDEDEDEDEAD